MTRKSHVVVAAGTALTIGLFAACSAMSAEAPVKGAHHFALGDSPTDKPTLIGETTKVDLSGDNTEDRFTLQDEVWSASFNVPLHYHKRHAEVFYILDGTVEWTIGGETQVMHAGDLAYIPPNTPHKVRVLGGKPLHTVFISTPGGYEDQELIEQKFSKDELDTPAAKALLAVLGDFNTLPDDTSIPSDTAGPGPHRAAHHYAVDGNYRTVVNKSGNVTSKILLSGDQSEGRFTIQDENWPADFNVERHYHKRHSEVFYVLGGEVEWTVGGETHLMHGGDLVYVPPNTPHKVHVTGGKPAHMLFIQEPGGYEMAVDLTNEYSKKQLERPAAKAAIADLHDFNVLADPNPYQPESD